MPGTHTLGFVVIRPVRRSDFTLVTAETSSTWSCSGTRGDGRKEDDSEECVLAGGHSLSVLAFTVSFCLTVARVHRPPGGSEACAHNLVIGEEAYVKSVSITHYVFGWDMTAVSA